MNLNNYNEFISYLYSKQDIKYQTFHSKLIKDKKIIGIKTPILKDIAKYISENDYKKIINYMKHELYEENIIHGLIIGYLKVPFKDILEELDMFMPYNTNWAINDITCANLKIFKKHQEEGYKYILNLIDSKKDWYIRFGLVLLLDHYINDKYIDNILCIADNIKSNEYYVKMANAWLLSICYIKYPNKTLSYLKKCDLDNFTFNKTIDKITDSYRVEKSIKEELKKLKRK